VSNDPVTTTSAEHHLHLPAGAHVADKRGLTAFGAVTIAMGLGLLGGTIDVITGPGLRTVFTVFFVLGCALAAVLVHREDLLATVVMPPLLYVALALFAAGVEFSGVTGGWLSHQISETVTALILGTWTLVSAVAAAAIVAIYRVTTGHAAPAPGTRETTS
jgi:hypothetical protein